MIEKSSGKSRDSCGKRVLGEIPEGGSLRKLTALPRKASDFPELFLQLNITETAPTSGKLVFNLREFISLTRLKFTRTKKYRVYTKRLYTRSHKLLTFLRILVIYRFSFCYFFVLIFPFHFLKPPCSWLRLEYPFLFSIKAALVERAPL